MGDAPQMGFNQAMINPSEASEETQRRTLVQLIKEEKVEEARQFLARAAAPAALVQAKSPELLQPPLFQAVQIRASDKAVEMSRALIELGAQVNPVDSYGQTPLFHICREGNVALLELFLERGANLNAEDHYKQTAIFYAAKEGHAALLQRMVERGAEVDHLDKLKETALFYAARDARREACEVLLEAGANPNTIDERRQTPLYFAMKNNNEKVVELLVARGALRTKDGRISKHEQARLQRPEASKECEAPRPAAPAHPKKKKPAPVEEQRLSYRIVYTDEALRTRELSEAEFLALKEVCPELCRVLQNPELLASDPAVAELVARERWQDAAATALDALRKSKVARVFNEPVDWVKLKIPDYPVIVQRPMDLSTVRRKLTLNVYDSARHFLDDVELVFANCRLYNGTESVVGKMGVDLSREWEAMLRSHELLERFEDEAGGARTLDPQAQLEAFFRALGPAEAAGSDKAQSIENVA